MQCIIILDNVIIQTLLASSQYASHVYVYSNVVLVGMHQIHIIYAGLEPIYNIPLNCVQCTYYTLMQ